MTAMGSLFPLVFFLLALYAWALFLVGLILVLRKRRKGPPGSKTVTLVVLAVGLAATTALLGYEAFDIYASQNTWTFSYGVSIMANGTGPEAVVLPIPGDEGLLRDLRATSATANWSVVDTPRGRGLYLRFTGSVMLDASVSLFPVPAVPPDTSPTMQDMANASEVARVWVFYPGGEGGRVDLSFTTWYAQVFLVPGWTSVARWPIPQAVA